MFEAVSGTSLPLADCGCFQSEASQRRRPEGNP